MKTELIMLSALLFVFTLVISCEKSRSLCGGNDPKNELSWLNQEISRLNALNKCYSISRSAYNKQTVFIISNCEANINSVPVLYNCDGTVMNLSDADYQNLKFTGSIELIWKSN